MKSKIAVFLIACSFGISAAYACSYRECGGGKTQCCKDVFGATYYCPTPPPPAN